MAYSFFHYWAIYCGKLLSIFSVAYNFMYEIQWSVWKASDLIENFESDSKLLELEFWKLLKILFWAKFLLFCSTGVPSDAWEGSISHKVTIQLRCYYEYIGFDTWTSCLLTKKPLTKLNQWYDLIFTGPLYCWTSYESGRSRIYAFISTHFSHAIRMDCGQLHWWRESDGTWIHY